MPRSVPLALAAAILAVAPAASAQQGKAAGPRPDLADVAAGTYHGDVISDARGSSRSDVTITVTKTGPNAIRVDSSYKRMPSFTTRLTRAMDTIQNAGSAPGKLSVFLLNTAKSPMGLDITVDDASWSGTRQS